MRSSSFSISVPFPTPDGPVMTKTLPVNARNLATQHGDEFGALTIRQAADRLRRRDTADLQDLVHLHAPVLRYGEQHVEDLRRLDEIGWIVEQLLDAGTARFEIALEGRASCPDLVRALERLHA